MSTGPEPIVTIVNRVRSATGDPVPFEGLFDGDPVVVRETREVPLSVAMVLIRQSMYRYDLQAGVGQYRLGCDHEQIALPTDPIPEADVSGAVELIDREAMVGPGHHVKVIRSGAPGPARDKLQTSLMRPTRSGLVTTSFGELRRR